jgi:AAA ATPase domain
MTTSEKAVNPYCAGAGTRPAVLAGRGRQLAMVDRMIAQFEGRRAAENIVWTGLRGMGKTVLLQEALDRFRDRGWLAGYHEARKRAGIGASVASILLQGHAVLGRGKVSKALVWLKELLGATTVTATVGDVTVNLGLEKPRDRALPEDALDALFVRLGEAAADAGVGAVFLFDEMQLVDRHDLSALLHAAQAVESLPVAFVGAGLPDLPGILASAGTYSERLFYDRVDWLPASDVADAIRGPASELGVDYSDQAVELLVELSESYPYFVQLFAEETWWAADVPADPRGTVIGVEFVERARPHAMRRLDEGLYRIRFEKASQGEQRFLQAMGELGDSRIRSGDVARTLGLSNQQASTVRDRLIAKGVVYSPAYNVLEFSVPGFGDYVRRHSGQGSTEL